MSYRQYQTLKKGIETIFENLRKRQDGLAHFTYTLKEWESQFWERPGEMELLRIDDIGLAIIEKKGDFDRVLFLSLKKNVLLQIVSKPS